VVVFRGMFGIVRWPETCRVRLLDGERVALCPSSDIARSCFIISVFSDLLAFLGSAVMIFAVIAHMSSAAATPISRMLSMYKSPRQKWQMVRLEKIVR